MSCLVDDSSKQFPFTTEILETKLLPNCKNPMLDRYDDSTDPDEHIDAYSLN